MLHLVQAERARAILIPDVEARRAASANQFPASYTRGETREGGKKEPIQMIVKCMQLDFSMTHESHLGFEEMGRHKSLDGVAGALALKVDFLLHEL